MPYAGRRPPSSDPSNFTTSWNHLNAFSARTDKEQAARPTRRAERKRAVLPSRQRAGSRPTAAPGPACCMEGTSVVGEEGLVPALVIHRAA